VRSISEAIRNERTTTQTDPFQANLLGGGQLAVFQGTSKARGRLMVRMNFPASPWSSSVLLTKLLIIPHNQIYNYMVKILHLFRFTDDSPSNPGAEIGSEASESKRHLRRVVVIPFRSPNDQQQVLIIRTFYTDGEGNCNFVTFNV
jgi:hypothetical protein